MKTETNPDIMNTLNAEVQNNQIRITELESSIQEQDKIISKGSEGYFKDILSDSHGMSLHRFQIFAWTILLGIVFIFNVWVNLSMPEFSATLLLLMGISSGTYLGFKLPQ